MGSLLTLTAPGVEPFSLHQDEGLRVTGLDVGWPETRVVADAMPGQSGTDDRTRLHGARVVTVTAQVHGTDAVSKHDVVSRLGRFCAPGLRPVMRFDTDGRASRAIDLRVDQFSAPLVGQAVTEVQVSWAAPSGLIRAAVPHVVTIPVKRQAQAVGRQYNLQPPRQYPHADPPGIVEVTNLGTAAAPWLIRIFGYCKNPKIVNDDGAPLVEFGVGPVPQLQYWECGSAGRTVLEDSTVGADRRNHLDFVASTWARLPPGPSTLEFTADDPAVPCKAEIEWYDQWLI